MTGRLFPAVALVVAFALFFMYVNPTYSGSVANTKAAIARDQAALDAAARFTEKQDQLAKAKSDINPADLGRLETLLPSSVDNVATILDLTALATRSGVQLSSINAVPPPQQASGDISSQSPVGSVDLTLNATGTYSAFRTFMKGIEHSSRLLDITTLSIKGSDTGVYTYDMTVRLYWLR